MSHHVSYERERDSADADRVPLSKDEPVQHLVLVRHAFRSRNSLILMLRHAPLGEALAPVPMGSAQVEVKNFQVVDDNNEFNRYCISPVPIWRFQDRVYDDDH